MDVDVVYMRTHTHTHTHTHTQMEYCSAMKKNEVVPFIATQMNLDIIILLSEVISYDITYI